MYLSRLTLTNFRSCAATSIRLNATLTVLTGENNAGKSNILDALRMVTAPSEVRRTRGFEPDDLRYDAKDLRLDVSYSGLDPAQQGLFHSALQRSGSTEAFYQLSWAPPTGTARRRSPVWTVGEHRHPEVEPEVRDLVRHVHLPALRDADRDLASSSPGRIEFLLRQLLAGKDDDRTALLKATQAASDSILNEAPLRDARDRVRQAFQPLAEGFQPHDAHLRFVEASLTGLARDLRFALIQQGLDPARLGRTGLGYSNLLYLASVLVELEAARDAELTLLLVEEPEAHLHPQLQQAILDFLHSKARESALRKYAPGENAGRIQVVVSTHSPNLTAATSIANMVVLRSARGSVVVPESDSMRPHSEANTKDADAPQPVAARTLAIAIADLGLSPQQRRKIDRYLDVTKSTLLFGRRVLLIEGIAEALLLPAFARLALTEAELGRFRACSVVAIDGVDFEPYVHLLLASPAGTTASIAERVVVITDDDPRTPEAKPDDEAHETVDPDLPDGPTSPPNASAGAARKAKLQALAAQLQSAHRLHIELSPFTLEASLFGEDDSSAASASPLLKRAFLACGGGKRRENAWAPRIDNRPLAERGRIFVDWLSTSGTRKGDFAQALAEDISEAGRRTPPESFPVPQHIRRALKHLVELCKSPLQHTWSGAI